MPRIITYRFLGINAHLVREGGTSILVDCGVGGQEGRLERALARDGVAPEDIALVVCTHGHYDHAGGARHFQERYGTPVMLGEGDLGMVRQGRMPPLSPYTLADRLVQALLVRDEIPAFEPDRVVSAPTSLLPFGIDAEAFPLPGHTRGSLCVAFGTDVFVGDLFRGGMLSPQSPRRHFFRPEVDANRSNVELLLARGFETFHCGHGGPVTRAALAAALDRVAAA